MPPSKTITRGANTSLIAPVRPEQGLHLPREGFAIQTLNRIGDRGSVKPDGCALEYDVATPDGILDIWNTEVESSRRKSEIS